MIPGSECRLNGYGASYELAALCCRILQIKDQTHVSYIVRWDFTGMKPLP